MLRYRVLLLDTKPSNPNHYIGIAIADALRNHALVDAVFPARYGNALDLARRNSCNLFFAWDGEELNTAICNRLADECGRSVLWVTEDPYELDQNLRNAQCFDCVFTNDSASVAAYDGKATHLPFAASELIHARPVLENESQYLYDILFVGTAWPNRVKFLQQLLAKKPDLKYKIGIPGNEHLPEPDLPMPKSQYDWRVANSELCRFASISKVVLTLHRDFSASNNPASAATPGPRLFETALAGGFQLIDMSQPEVSNLYAKGTEFVGFSTLDEAITGIEWALSNPQQRREIARAAQLRTRQQHLYAHRIAQVLDSVEKVQDSRSVGFMSDEKTRVLFLSHNVVQNQPFGGVEVYQDLLQKELATYYDIYIYSAVQHDNGTQDYTLLGPNGSILERYNLKNLVSNDVISDPEREKIFSAVLDKYDFSLVHVHHLMYHPLGLPYIVKAFGIPMIVTFHDYYLLCKRFTMLDYRGEYCGPGICPSQDCDRCMQEILIPAGEHDRWRSFAGAMLDLFDRYIISVKSIADIIALTYPQISMTGRTELLPLPTRKHALEITVEKRLEAEWLHVAVPGNFTHPKGAEVLLAVFAEMRDDPVRFHILGRIDEPYSHQMDLLKLNNVLAHGGYLPEEADAMLAQMNISLILSIWPETYVLTLSESWNNGVVPIVTDIGALGERVQDGVNGFKVRPRNVQDVVERLRILMKNPCLLEQVRRTIAREKLFPTVEEHLSTIHLVYQSLIPVRHRITSNVIGKVSTYVPAALTLRDCGILVQPELMNDRRRSGGAANSAFWQRLGWLLKVGVLSLRKNGFKSTAGKTVRWMQKKTRGI